MNQNQVSASVNEAPVFPAKNRVFMCGEILALTSTGILLQTVNKSANGTDYAESHPIVIDPAVVTGKGMDIGSRCQFYGLIAATENRIQRIHAYPQTLDKGLAVDANIVEIAGKIGTTAYTPTDPIIGKQGFARSFVNVAKDGQPAKNVRVVMFQDMARIWAKVPPGSDVLISGRVRNRERSGYVTESGDMAVYTEIIADASRSRVLKQAVVVDAFKGVDFDALEAGMTAAPAEAPTQTEETPKAKAKGGKKKDAVPDPEHF